MASESRVVDNTDMYNMSGDARVCTILLAREQFRQRVRCQPVVSGDQALGAPACFAVDCGSFWACVG